MAQGKRAVVHRGIFFLQSVAVRSQGLCERMEVGSLTSAHCRVLVSLRLSARSASLSTSRSGGWRSTPMRFWRKPQLAAVPASQGDPLHGTYAQCQSPEWAAAAGGPCPTSQPLNTCIVWGETRRCRTAQEDSPQSSLPEQTTPGQACVWREGDRLPQPPIVLRRATT